jgi:hypothetical protein
MKTRSRRTAAATEQMGDMRSAKLLNNPVQGFQFAIAWFHKRPLAVAPP